MHLLVFEFPGLFKIYRGSFIYENEDLQVTDNIPSPDFEAPAGNSFALNPTLRQTEQVVVTPLPAPKIERSSVFSAFRYRNYRLFWFGACVSNLGNWMQTVGQNWLVLSLTGSPFMLGLVNFIANSPMLVLSLFGGVIADRNSRKTVLLVTQNLMALLVLAMAILTFFNIINVWLVLAIALGIGVVQAFNSPAYQTIMLDLVGKDDLMNAIAMNSMQFNLTRIIGPSIGGLLVSAFGVAACFFFNSLSFLAVIVALMLVRIPKVAPQLEKRSALLEIRESFGYLRQNREMLALLAIASAMSIFVIPYLTLLPVFVRNVFKLGPDYYGILLSAVGVGALTGAFLVAQASGEVKKRSRFMLIGMLVNIVGMVGLGLSGNFVLTVVILAFCGGAMVISNATLNTIIQTSVPDEMRGRIISIWTLCTMGLMPIGNLQSGTVAELFGAPFSMLLNTGVFSILLGLIIFYVPRIREF